MLSVAGNRDPSMTNTLDNAGKESILNRIIKLNIFSDENNDDQVSNFQNQESLVRICHNETAILEKEQSGFGFVRKQVQIHCITTKYFRYNWL